MTVDEWLAQHAITSAEFRGILLRGIGDVNPTLDARVRSASVLDVTITGPRREDGAYDFKTTFSAVISDCDRGITWLFLQSFGDLAVPTRMLTGRLLCNVVALAELLRMHSVAATPRPASSLGHLRAGFLPIQASWDTLRALMAAHLRTAGTASGEAGAASSIASVLASPEPRSIRDLMPNAGMSREPGILWPQTCQVLLDAMPGWSGSMDLADADTTAMHRGFCRSNGG